MALFIFPNISFAATVIGWNAGTDLHTVDFAKYGTACFLLTSSTVINSLSIGITKSDNNFVISKLYNNDTNTVDWSFGPNDVRSTTTVSNSVSTTTTNFTLAAGTHCVTVGSNTGSEYFHGSQTNGGLISPAYGATLSEVIANQAGSQVAYFGDVNFSLCNASENPCPLSTIALNGNTRIIEKITPTDGQVTSSSAVTLSYTYFFNSSDFGTYEQACVELTNATISQSLNALCSSIGASGQSTFSTTTVLTQGQQYTWRPFLTASTTSVGRIYAPAGWFSVVSAPVNQSIVPPTNATSTSALQSWFTGVQASILGVPPWSYWVQIRRIMLTSAEQLTATSTVPSFTFPIGTASSSIHFNQSLFDKTAMNAFIPESAWAPAKALEAGVLWVLFALMIYAEVDRRFSKHHS